MRCEVVSSMPELSMEELSHGEAKKNALDIKDIF
jgi:hypothetical protein